MNSNMGLPVGLRDLLVEFWDPIHNSETVQARKCKVGMNIEREWH